jgi:hypothetical protein
VCAHVLPDNREDIMTDEQRTLRVTFRAQPSLIEEVDRLRKSHEKKFGGEYSRTRFLEAGLRLQIEVMRRLVAEQGGSNGSSDDPGGGRPTSG